MHRGLWSYFAGMVILFSSLDLHAQAVVSQAKAQEDFALAVARAHSESSLFSVNAQPFVIHADAVSSLALHGTGKGTYEYRRVDAEHFKRVVSFPDYQSTEIRNDSGHPWIVQSSDAIPIRIVQFEHFVLFHVPNSTEAAAYNVTESTVRNEQNELLTCYSAARPPADGFPHPFRWCFDTRGLLVLEDLPIDMHIAYGDYVDFQGKKVFTQAHIAVGNLSALNMEISYSELDPHALDSLVQESSMHRSKSAESEPNPEDVQRATVEYRFIPPLPPGTPEAVKNEPVPLHFLVGADSTLLDACVESAPTQAMAEAALEAARKYTFTSAAVDGKLIRHNFWLSIWFHDGANASSDAIAKTPAERASADSVRASSIAASAPSNTYRNDDLSLVFRYPADFEPIPHGQLEEWLRKTANQPHHTGLKSGESCNVLLFAAQRLLPGDREPENVSIKDIDPSCITGVVDRKTLESTVADGAHAITDHWIDGRVSKPKLYKVNGRSFAVVLASGIPHTTAAESSYITIVATTARNHVLVWIVGGPHDNLASILAASTVQIGVEMPDSLLPKSEVP